MKRFFTILGAIFLGLIVLGVVAFVFIATRGFALDKESKGYAESAIPAIVTTWSEKELFDRASPEFKKAVTIEGVDRLFQAFSKLGRLQKCEPAQGQATMSTTTQSGKKISAQYTTKGTFENGDATIKLDLIKHGSQWQILGLRVDSPLLRAR